MCNFNYPLDDDNDATEQNDGFIPNFCDHCGALFASDCTCHNNESD